jgi:NADPH-dependent 2,4-dienoyl-CoA reductase/sulfur reductase-like enzyme
MKVVIIGGLAAGPKVATRIRRLCDTAKVTILEKSEFFSYTSCALPYYISGMVREKKDLITTPSGTIRDELFFKNVKDVNVMNYTETTDIDCKNKKVFICNKDGNHQELDYDKLVFATGTKPFVPSIPGIKLENIFTLKDIHDADAIKERLTKQKTLNAVIIGSDFLGIEIVEALQKNGCHVTIIEQHPHILPVMDSEMAALVEKHLKAQGTLIQTVTKVTKFIGRGKVEKVLTNKGEIFTDIVIMATDCYPETKLAINAGLEIGSTGGIVVNKQMQTSNPDIYAVGACAEKKNLITDKPYYVSHCSNANNEGRVAANAICGIDDSFPGILDSTISKVFDYSIGRTGLGENEARDMGYDIVIAFSVAPDRFHAIPTAKPLFLKLIADKKSRKLLGAQTVGLGVANRSIDIAAMAITSGMNIDQIAQLDMPYSPLFSPATDNTIIAVNILRNKIDGLIDGISPSEVITMLENKEPFTFLDVRSLAEFKNISIEGTQHIPIGTVRRRINEIDRSKPIVAFCKSSLRG